MGLSFGFLAAQSAQSMYPCLTQVFGGGLGGGHGGGLGSANNTIATVSAPDPADDYEPLYRRRRSLVFEEEDDDNEDYDYEEEQGKIILKKHKI